MTSGLPRRRFLGGLGAAGAAGALVGGTAVLGADRVLGDDPADAVVPFRGRRQAGIVTPAQDRLHFVALDVTTDDRQALVALLRRWTAAAERMTTGGEAAPGGAVGGDPYAPPDDTGEAMDLSPSHLTVTFGVGASLLDRLGVPRPPALADLPPFAGDRLEPSRCGGDLCLQACADDPQVAVHAVRNLVRAGFGTTSVRWSQLGFGRTSSTSDTQVTHRNLFGFKDGTRNLRAEDTAGLDEHVWVAGADGPAWMVGGSYLVARRIRMHIETWDRTSLAEQQALTGRYKGSGAPIGGRDEYDPVDLAALGVDGEPIVARDAHIRLAAPESHGGARMLRRGYSFVDGSDGAGHLDAGLFFVAFVRDPHRGFVPVQRVLARHDRMSEYLEHTGSAVFACPPGPDPDGYWGQGLLEG